MTMDQFKTRRPGDPIVQKLLDVFLDVTGWNPDVVHPDAHLVRDLQLTPGEVGDLLQRIKALCPSSNKSFSTVSSLRDLYHWIVKNQT